MVDAPQPEFWGFKIVIRTLTSSKKVYGRFVLTFKIFKFTKANPEIVY